MSAAPSSWRIGGCAGCCGGRLTVFAVPTRLCPQAVHHLPLCVSVCVRPMCPAPPRVVLTVHHLSLSPSRLPPIPGTRAVGHTSDCSMLDTGGRWKVGSAYTGIVEATTRHTGVRLRTSGRGRNWSTVAPGEGPALSRQAGLPRTHSCRRTVSGGCGAVRGKATQVPKAGGWGGQKARILLRPHRRSCVLSLKSALLRRGQDKTPRRGEGTHLGLRRCRCAPSPGTAEGSPSRRCCWRRQHATAASRAALERQQDQAKAGGRSATDTEEQSHDAARYKVNKGLISRRQLPEVAGKPVPTRCRANTSRMRRKKDAAKPPAD